MLEISGIQVLSTVLIIVLFFLVFKILETNWSLKTEEYRQEEIPAVQAEETESMESIPEIILAKEIRLIPVPVAAEEPPDNVVHITKTSKEVVFSIKKEEENVLEYEQLAQ